MEHKITLNSPWFEYVKMGKKTFEGRRNSLKTQKFKLGDKLYISHHLDKKQEPFIKTIKNIIVFESFQQGLEIFNEKKMMDKVLPEIETVNAGIEIYQKFVSLETQKKEGVCFIELY